MRYHVLAADYDGTLAKDGRVELAAKIEDIERTQDLSPAKSRELIVGHIQDRFKPQW